MKTTYRPMEGYKIITSIIKSSGHNACSALIVLIAEWEPSIYDSCHFDIGRFRAEPTNYERRLHPSDTFAYRGAHNYWFITLRVIHKLKTGAMTNAVRITAQPTGKAFPDNTEHVNWRVTSEKQWED